MAPPNVSVLTVEGFVLANTLQRRNLTKKDLELLVSQLEGSVATEVARKN